MKNKEEAMSELLGYNKNYIKHVFDYHQPPEHWKQLKESLDMLDEENQSEFDFDEESVKKLRRVFGPFGKEGKEKTDYEVFKEWHDQWMKDKENQKPPK